LQIRAPSGHHHHNIPEIVTWRSLVGLGISGGLVPCPDAIAILLVAVAIHRIVLGLALILAFSFGLALVLIAIGVAIVHGTHFLSRFDSFEKVAPVLPVISAVVVTLLGAFLTVNAVQSQTATGQAQNVQTAAPALAPTLLSATAPPKQEGSIVYLTLDANGYSQLAQVAPTGGDPTILTTEPYGVRDYTIDPASRRIIYSAWRSDGGSDLWYLALDGSLPSRLLACRQSACSSPIWLPGLSRLIYLLQYIPLPGGAPGAMAVWSLDTTTGETRMLPVADNALGVNPQLSPDGHWLAYETLPSQSLRVVALDRMESIDVENTLGGNKAWRPDSRALVMTGVVEVGGQYSDGLWSIDPATGDHIDLTAAPEINDRMPMWSPDGERLAFVRYVQNELGDTEAQVWLVTRDGKDAHPVVSGQPYAFDRLSWSPDGRTLLAEARLLTGERTIPSLWRIDVSTGQITRLVRPGSMATWTP
jgi:Tol biopolymer transport system component